jgi:ATP-dependent DNA ligase
VICDARGVNDFDALARGGSPAVLLYAFDLLEHDRQDLRRSPWESRRASLTALLCGLRKGSDCPRT